jgi:HlyD family secretion protein
MTARRWLLALAFVMVALAIGLFTMRGPAALVVETEPVTRPAQLRSTVTASGEIVATRYADIGSSVMGKIVDLPVKEGDRVKAGQVLARIDAVQARSDVTAADALVSALEAEARAAGEQTRTAEAELRAAEAAASEANQTLARRRDLLARGLVSQSDLDNATATATAATARVTAAKAQVEATQQARAAADRRIAQARAQRTRATDIYDKTSIASPIDGVVTRLRVRTGEMVVVGIQNQPGTTLMTISDLGQIDAEVKVAEADVLRVALDQPATITLEAVADTSFRGRVVEIGASALPVTANGASAREFKVVIRLDSPSPGLRPGLTCDAEIVTSEKTGVLTVPLQSVVLRPQADGSTRTGVFVVRDGRSVFTPVTTGVIGGLAIEVTGVNEGDAIVAGPYQVLRDLKDGDTVSVTAAR